MKFAEASAPGEEEELVELLFSDGDESDDRKNNVSEELDNLVSKYQTGITMEKLVILSLIDYKRYTNKRISEIFVFILNMTKKTVSLSKQEWHIPMKKKKKKNTCSRLDINKCEIFHITFLTIE